MGKYVLALDQGTTSTRAILFDRNGNAAFKCQKTLTQYYPASGWVEHDPEEIFDAAMEVISDVISQAGVTADDIVALGITNQRETTVVWDKTTGKPVCNAIVWQCRRTAPFMEKMKEQGKEDLVYSKTGLTCDAYFSASKIKWILDNVPLARKKAEMGKLCAGTVDSFLLFRFTKGKVHATDRTNASRTLLYNIHTLSWDDELCSLFDIPPSVLPAVYSSGYRYGETDASLFGGAIPICALVGDQQGALFGQKCWQAGDIKNTYGTGCFLLMNTGEKAIISKRGLITTLAATTDNSPQQYVLEGSVFIGGAAIQWLRDEMGLISSSEESERLARSVPNSGGVFVVPAFTGLGAPHWDAQARGLITGITRGTNRAHIVRATLEAIAYQTFDVLHAMERDLGDKVTELKVDGGASANSFLMQFQADILSARVIRPDEIETTALGAAYLAGLTCGFWSDFSEISSIKSSTIFSPQLAEPKRRELILSWAEAVARAKIK